MFPFPLSSACNSIADGYIDEIFAWIDAGLEALDICQKIGLCSSDSAKRAVRRPLQKAKVDATLCDISQEIVHYIAQLVFEGFVKEDIEALVAELCQALPAPLSAVCTGWIDGHIGEIIADIDGGVGPLAICGKMRMCSARDTPIGNALKPRRPLVRRPQGDALCGLCQQAIPSIEKEIGSIERAIGNDAIEANLHDLVSHLFSSLPYPLGAVCISTFDARIDDVIMWIGQQSDALHVCQKLGLCTSPRSITMRKVERPRAKPLTQRKTVK